MTLLPTVRAGDSPFIPGSPIQHSWDSTCLGTIKECPRKYQLSILEGWRPKRTSTNLSFGSHIHKAVENFEKNLAHGETRDQALEHVLTDALVQSKDMEPYKNKSRETLMYAIVDYVDNYAENDRAKTMHLTDGTPASELSFKAKMPLAHKTPVMGEITYCGHLDRIANFEGTPYVVDLKTTMNTLGGASSHSFFAQYDPDTQFSGYTWGGNVAFGIPVRGVIVEGIQVAKTFTRFERGISHRTPAQIDEWQIDVSIWVGMSVAFAELNRWPMNEKSCHKWGGCQFRGICGRDPNVRQAFLETDFTKENPWNPLVERTTTGDAALEEAE